VILQVNGMIADQFEGFNVLTQEECELMIREGKKNMQNSTIFRSDEQKTIESLTRSSKTGFFTNSSSFEVKKILDKLASVFKEIVFYNYRFPLCSVESPQFINYIENDYFTWHIDSAPRLKSEEQFIDRDFSMSVILSCNSEYEGGLEFVRPHPHNIIEVKKIEEEQGQVIIFPSNTIHRVSPVRGERSSLVCWASHNYGGKNL